MRYMKQRKWFLSIIFPQLVTLSFFLSSCPDPVDQTRPWNTGCGNVTLNDRLSLFSQWRGTVGDDGTGLWHLMSGCPTGTEVGGLRRMGPYDEAYERIC